MIMTKFICDVCETDFAPQSTMWEEMCVYCNEMCLVANLEVIRNEIREHELDEAIFKPRLAAQLAKPEPWIN